MITKKVLLGILAIGLITLTGCEKQRGCTEPNAINFDSAAEENDGSCLYSNSTDTIYITDTVYTSCGRDTATYVNCDGSVFTWDDVTNPTTGRTWMDRNLGASQSATSHTDSDAYGDLFQWGRAADGHQCRNSNTTSGLSSNDLPGHGEFILNKDDWKTTKNDNLWQGVEGINNPCPTGYRVPTEKEWEDEIATWDTKDVSGGYGSVLKLPSSGFRYPNDGALGDVNHYSNYWSSTIKAEKAIRLYVVNDASGTIHSNRVDGYSVRCIKD